jgi:phosphate starvation-inducible PhoH-like protein
VEGVAVARFTEKDVVRHPLVSRIIRAYESSAKPVSEVPRTRRDER